MANEGYIGVTDRGWFDYLKDNYLVDGVNFWRKDIRQFKSLNKGGLFFFLVKNNEQTSGERKVEGYAIFERYEVLSLDQAWDKYENLNGVQNYQEFSSRFVELYGQAGSNISIGCIILNGIRFFDNSLMLSDVDIEFPNAIVSGKGIGSVEANKILDNAIYSYEEDYSYIVREDDLPYNQGIEQSSFTEGRKKLGLHFYKERNKQLIQKAKNNFKNKNGRLYCEVCGFEYCKKYGEIGNDYIEGHHILPISELQGESETNVSDILLVCANCHRMLHRKRNPLSKSELQQMMIEKRIKHE